MSVAIGRRRRWQPPVTAKLDTSHPLAKGLGRCYLSDGQSWIDVANGGRRMTPGTTDRNAAGVGEFGRASAQWATDPKQCASDGSPDGYNNARITWSVAMTCGTFGRGNTVGITSLIGDETGTTDCFLRFGDSGQPNNVLQMAVGGGGTNLQSVSTFNTGQSYTVSVRCSSSGRAMFINGKIDVSDAVVFTNGLPQTNFAINYNSLDPTGRRGIHAVHVAMLHDRAITTSEAVMFAADPFCMLRW